MKFTLATSESWRDKQSGEKRDRTEWHNVVIYNENLGKVASQYLRKGSKVYLEGAIQSRKYQDNSGNDRYITEIVLQRFRGELTLLDGRGDSSGDAQGGGYDRGSSSGGRDFGGGGGGSGGGAKKPAFSGGDFADDLDDDVPF